jgi:hypothetical protein
MRGEVEEKERWAHGGDYPFEFLQDPEVRSSDPEALTKRPASATLRSDPLASWIDPPQDLMRADDGGAVHPQVTMSST